MNKKILMIGVALLAICISVGAVSAWEWNFSSSSSSSSDGGDISFENGVLKLQGVEFKIPEGYKQNESGQKLAEDAPNIQGAKASLTEFIKDGKSIITKVFFFPDNSGEITNLTTSEAGFENKTIGGINGIINPNLYGDNTPTFRYIVDGKLVEVNAPDEATIESVIKK